VDSFIPVDPAANLTLQDIEKGLSELMAAIFWTSTPQPRFTLHPTNDIPHYTKSVTSLQFTKILSTVAT
jgi:hypothetical protein